VLAGRFILNTNRSLIKSIFMQFHRFNRNSEMCDLWDLIFRFDLVNPTASIITPYTTKKDIHSLTLKNNTLYRAASRHIGQYTCIGTSTSPQAVCMIIAKDCNIYIIVELVYCELNIGIEFTLSNWYIFIDKKFETILNLSEVKNGWDHQWI